MIHLVLKKNFFDFIDNALLLAVVNIFVLFVMLSFFLPLSAIKNYWLITIFVASANCVFMLLFFAISDFALSISKDKSVSIKFFFRSIKNTIRASVCFALFLLALGIVFSIALPFYFSIENLFGKIFAFATVWFAIFLMLALQWLPAIFVLQNENEKKIIPCVKKAIFIFVDNTAFSFVIFLNTLFLLLLSIFSLGIFPSFSGIALSYVNALCFRLKKYEGEKKNKIDWNEILCEEKKELSKKTLASIFFPYKKNN